MKLLLSATLAACLALTLSACGNDSSSTAPKKEEPKAQTNMELTNAVKTPLDKTNATEATILDGVQQQKNAIEAQESGTTQNTTAQKP